MKILLLAALLALCSATTLTYRMAPHEKACFHTTAKKVGEKMAFYFAVQQGGNFDIDFEVLGPSGNNIVSGHKERQRDIIFSSRAAGEHTFCFSNVMSTLTEKVVDFDITAENETDPEHPIQKVSLPGHSVDKSVIQDQLTNSEQALRRIRNTLDSFARDQKYYRTRERRNFATVKSTEARVFWFSVIESFMMIGMALVQVYLIQSFFSKGGGPQAKRMI
ncbi:MAG: hypothetical protein SGCHY_001108 [Lobulomycetales sp.]